jgi:pSer/pThr/pTyr-binding forkhead associated (FHA) protein
LGAKLLYRDGNGRDASIDVVPEGVFLGRGADCAVRTDDAMVSRKNCKIALAGGRWMVEDLGSSNGTFVNEVRIQKQALNHADVVRCGTLQVRFVETADAAPMSNKPKTTSMPAQNLGVADSVQIDPSLQQAFGNAGGALNPAALMQQKDYELQQVSHERDALAARLREAMQELEAANSRAEGGNAELQRLRTENVSQRDRLAQVQREKSLQEEEIHEITKAANELRDDLDKARREASENKQRVDELTDEKEAHERQLERAHEDVQRTKQMTEEMRGKLGEIQKAKDDNWKEVNARIAEIDQLRQVIDQQTNLLKERDVGLMTFESTIKDLRTEKEKLVRDQVAIKNERDEL